MRLLVIGTLAGATAAVAQAPSISAPAPPMPSNIDERGVDLISGKLSTGATDLSIGPSDHRGLTLSRQWSHKAWRINNIPTMSGSTAFPIVSFGGRSVPFETVTGGTYKAVFEDGSTLSNDRTTFTASDGTQITFTTGYQIYTLDSSLGIGTQVTFPDGTRWTFNYQETVQTLGPEVPEGCYNNPPPEMAGYCWYMQSLQQQYYMRRLSSITTSTGYQIKFDYALNSGITFGNMAQWWSIWRATALNNKVEYCNPTADTCSYANTWPQVTYSSWYDGKMTSVTDPVGRVTNYSYNGYGGYWHLSGIRPPGAGSNTVTYSYTGDKVASATVNGGTWNYAYPSTTQTTVTDPNSQTWTTNYNGIGQVTSIVSPPATGSLTSRFGYCGTSDPTCPEDLLKWSMAPQGTVDGSGNPTGGYTRFEYDARGNVTCEVRIARSPSGSHDLTCGAPSNDSKIRTRVGYSSGCSNQKICNKPEWTEDALAKVTNYEWNTTHGGLNWVKAPADANGIRPETRMSYTGYQAYYKNSGGSIVASGITTYLPTQTASCRTTSSCTGGTDERKTVIAYGPQSAGTGNNLDAVTATTSRGDGWGAATTTATYDNYGRVQTVDGPLGADTARIRYNLAGQVIGKVSPDPDDSGGSKYPAVRYTYNSWGQAYLAENGSTNGLSDGDLDALTVVTNSLTEYDGYGRPIRQKARDASNNSHQVTDVVYDALGRGQCSITRMDMGNLGVNGYCDNTIVSNAIQIVSANGPDRVTYNHYDALGRVWKVTSGYGVAAVDDQILTFTNNGQLATVKDAENNLTTYVYDGHDRGTQTQYPNTTKGAGSSNGSDYEQVGYDANGNVTSFRTRRGETLTYAYDNLNRLLVKYVPERSGLSTTHTRDVYYAYDLFGGMIYARYDNAAGEGVTNYYDALGRNTGSTLGMDGVARTLVYDYNAANGFTRLTYPDSNYVDYHRYGSNQLWHTALNSASGLFHPTYDGYGRPAAMHRLNTAVPDWNLYSWIAGYDAVSRVAALTQEFAGTSNDTSTSFTYNPAGQITSTARSNDAFAWTGAANVNRGYTSNGLSQYSAVAGTSFTHDGNGNLTSDGTNTFIYDVENRLVSRSGGASATLRYDPLGRLYEVVGSATTRFLHDGSDLVAEYNGSGNLLRRYVHGISGGDDPQVWFEGSSVADSARRYLYSDERGSVIAVTDSTGNVLNRTGYDEYGLFSESNASYASRFKYTGQAYIPELGMYYYKARMYSPTLGRFMQTDPIGYGDGMNMYAYVKSDPVNAVDPSGLKDCDFSKLKEGDLPVCGQPIRGGGPGGGNGAAPPSNPTGLPTAEFMCEHLSAWQGIVPKLEAICKMALSSVLEAQDGLTCEGVVTFSAVGPLPQASGDSAFAPGTKPANGTVAIAGAKTFGFGRQALREGKAGAIKINPQGLDDLLKETGGPLPPYTVSDYGDVNIRNAPGSRFDIYRFSTKEGALKFGLKRDVPTTITVPAGGHCPPGTKAK